MKNNLGNKTVMAENIKFYMQIHEENGKDLSKLFDVPYTTLCDWINGKTYPRIDKIELMARHWGVEKADLVEPPRQKKNKFIIPVLGKVVAGYPIEAVENIIDYEEISETMARQGEFFALRIQGDSMQPKFSEGDVVIVRKQESVDNGDVAIIMVNGDEATIKKIQRFDGGINLIPTNPAYNIITYTNKEIIDLPVKCLGKVVELRAKF